MKSQSPHFKKLSILLVEDTPADAELMHRAIEGFVDDLRWHVVADADALEKALDRDQWDVVLCDWSVTGYSGKQAMNLIHQRRPDLPVILVTGSLEDTDASRAASSLTNDYILKDRLGRLPLAIRDAVSRASMTQAKEQLDYLAEYDALTNLHNRSALITKMEEAIARAAHHGYSVVLIHLDLDRFQLVNNSLGHDAGDFLLRTVAARLRDAVRSSDSVARFGDDEFGLVIDHMFNPKDCAQIVRNLLDKVAQPVMYEGHQLYGTASAGLSYYPQDGEAVRVLMRNADIAMHRAKKAGPGSFEYFSEEMGKQVYEGMVLANALHGALERKELFLEYQPKVILRTGKVTSVEALVRWNHPERGLVSPAEFIPMAEETGMILQIGEWVLKEACKQLSLWRERYPELEMAVNLSARQFALPDLATRIEHILEANGLPAEALQLELTESSLMADMDTAARMLAELHGIGVKLAIDDFGTGYSSLSHLKRIPADVLKIDRSFVRGLPDDTDDVALVRTILVVARSLGMRTTAEGVETEAQRKFMRDAGCDEFQGFLFSRPLAPEHLEALLEENARSPVRRLLRAISSWFKR